jgi:hypothetical protein
MFSKAVSSGALSTSVDMVAMGMKLTANATPMPAPFAIVDQTHQVQHDAAETIFSEHQCHRTPFALSTKRSSSSAHGIYLWFSSPVRLGTKNAKYRRASCECSEAILNQTIAGCERTCRMNEYAVARLQERRSFVSESNG